MSKINTDTQNKLNSIKNTKEQIRQAINTLNGSEVLDASAAFSKYADSIGVSAPKTYTVKIDTTNPDPEAALTYMDDAIGMTPGYDGWKKTPLMKNIKPCLLKDGVVNYYIQKDNYTLKEDGNPSILTGADGDVMVEIPLMGYKMWNDDTYQYVSVTTDPNREKDGYCYYAHSLDNEKDCDKIYMGAYLGYVEGNKLHSRSDISPTNNINLPNLRINAKNKGIGYSLLSFYPYTLMQCLYVIVYKNLNSQLALGQGCIVNSSKKNTGNTNFNTFCYGTNSGTQQIKLFGIEDFYGNLSQRLDGLQIYQNNVMADYNNSIFDATEKYKFKVSDTYSYTPPVGDSHLHSVIGTNISGFFIKSGTEGGDYNQYYCDYGIPPSKLDSGNFTIGKCDNEDVSISGSGIFHIDSNSRLCNARLMYKHQRPESAPPQ